MEKGDNYEKKQFGGIIKIKSNGELQMTERCNNVASSWFPPKHQIVVAGQLFSGKSGVRLLDCTSSTLIQDGGEVTETQREMGCGGELPHSSTEGLWSQDSHRSGEAWRTPTSQPRQPEHTVVWRQPGHRAEKIM